MCERKGVCKWREILFHLLNKIFLCPTTANERERTLGLPKHDRMFSWGRFDKMSKVPIDSLRSLIKRWYFYYEIAFLFNKKLGFSTDKLI